MKKTFCLMVVLMAFSTLLKVTAQPAYDINKDRLLYTVGYGHLDSQWLWDYPFSINVCLKNTLTENFYLFEKYPNYVYNFTGSRRYRMMKEYYPELYKTLKEYVAKGRWHVSGSSVDEGEVNISSPESLIRQVLYGNKYFRQEFGKESMDYMLPDCFGFVASLPSVLNHAGVIGFSTQKLTWGAVTPCPFNVGVWNGLDGKGVIAALNAMEYVGRVEPRLDLSEYWDKRLKENEDKYGIRFDYRYFGVGDQGGGARPNDVKNLEGSLNNPDSKFKILPASSDQMYKDVTPEIKSKLPTYQGDLLLTEHSAGSMTSVAYMKRLNRKNENLAYSAELASSMATQFAGLPYPANKINESWELVLGSQMHDILPGTSILKAYEYAWNDEFIAGNGFEQALRGSFSSLSSKLNTETAGRAIVVYNPVAMQREDVVSVELDYTDQPTAIKVIDSKGREVPSQVVGKKDNKVKILFLATTPASGMSVYDVQTSASKSTLPSALKVTSNSLENEYYKVTLAINGDIESIYDKKQRREILEQPASLQFQYENPRSWPSWNMDWNDRRNDPIDQMNKNVSFRIAENGPVRVAIEVTRSGQNSTIKQTISLAAGAAGKRVEVDNVIDWQSKAVSLKAAFPLVASNPMASYNLGTGVIERPNNYPKQFEVPSKGWFNLTDKSGSHGVSILEDCKYGSDKPSDNTIRLTLMYTPGVRNSYKYEGTQDWGIHTFKYGVYSHAGNWQSSETPWQAEFLNKPLVSFEAPKHKGTLGKEFAFLQISSPKVGLMALKKAEESDYMIVRVNELTGKDQSGVKLTFAAPIAEAYEVNGQEKRIGDVSFSGNALTTNMGYFGIRSFAVKLANSAPSAIKQTPIALEFDQDVMSWDENRVDAGRGLNYPAELIPDEIVSEGIVFKIGNKEDEKMNALAANGQTIKLPEGNYKKVYILAAAMRETEGEFTVGESKQNIKFAPWNGFFGQHYNRVLAEDDIEVLSITKPFLNKDNIAWFASHNHIGYPSQNNTYNYCYMYKYEINIPEGATSITLPTPQMPQMRPGMQIPAQFMRRGAFSSIRIMAMTAVGDNGDSISVTTPLYDDFSNAVVPEIRK